MYQIRVPHSTVKFREHCIRAKRRGRRPVRPDWHRPTARSRMPGFRFFTRDPDTGMASSDKLRVGLAQIAPVWIDKTATIRKVCEKIDAAARAGAGLVCFGEGLVPGYPFWPELTDGAVFDSAKQKRLFSHYSTQAVSIESGDLEAVVSVCRGSDIAAYLGIIERASDRTGHSLYASLVYIDAGGSIRSVHRKLVPTYEERLVWSPGDGHGLRTHRLGTFTAGGLNCWENWMPLSRAALYAQGEDLHVAVWPGNRRNTEEITRFIALESRSFVVSVSGFMTPADIDDATPYASEIKNKMPAYAADGGSCVAAPDGSWVIEPVCNEESLIIADLDHARVREERQNFDPAGHYSRPDVVSLNVNRRRQNIAAFDDD